MKYAVLSLLGVVLIVLAAAAPLGAWTAIPILVIALLFLVVLDRCGVDIRL